MGSTVAAAQNLWGEQRLLKQGACNLKKRLANSAKSRKGISSRGGKKTRKGRRTAK